MVGVLVLGLPSALGACSAEGTDPSSSTRSGATAAGSTATAAARPSAAETAEVAALLRRRAAALVAGDEAGYAGTVADASGDDGIRQLGAYAAARALRVSRLEVGTVLLRAPGDGGATAVPGTARAEVEVRYRVDDLDSDDRTARLAYELLLTDGRWSVASERPVGSSPSPPWVAMPDLRVRRGEHAVVAGTAPVARLAEQVTVVDRALPALRSQWTDTPPRVLVLVPATASEADALLGRSTTALGAVAATTEGPTGRDGTATGDRVVLDPTAGARLTASGREVVLTHELTHVAVRATVPGRAATWLAEGYADHVGYGRAKVPTSRLLAPLAAEVRAGHAPRELPGTADLQPTTGALEVPYLAAWQAVELVAERHGEAALRGLVVEGSSTGSDAEAEAATDRALERVLGTSRAELTAAWQQRLRDLR